jgi:hypothetical protein
MPIETLVVLLIVVSCMAFAGCLNSWLTPILIRSVHRRYKNDPSAPSLTIAWIGHEQRWYISVCRYTQKFGQGKEVVMNVYGESLNLSVVRMALTWFFRYEKKVPSVRPLSSAKKELRDAILFGPDDIDPRDCGDNPAYGNS